MIAMTKTRTIGQVSLSATEDRWQRHATAAAIAAARGVVQMDGPIPPGTPIGRLSDTEWGWIVAAVLFGWIGRAPSRRPRSSSTASAPSE